MTQKVRWEPKFRVGDRVKIIKLNREHAFYDYKGFSGTVLDVDSYVLAGRWGYEYRVYVDRPMGRPGFRPNRPGLKLWFEEESLAAELVEIPTQETSWDLL